MDLKIWEGMTVPKLSPRLRNLVKKLHDTSDLIATEASKTIVASISDYRHSEHDELVEKLLAAVSIHAKLWFGTLLNQRLPSNTDLEPALNAARRRAHQGVSLEGYLRAYRLGTVVMWQPIFVQSGNDALLHKEILFKVSPFLLLYSDAIAREMTRAFNSELAITREGKKKLKMNLWEIITSRPRDEAFMQFSEMLGMPSGALYCTAVINPRRPEFCTPEKLDELEQYAERIWSDAGASVFCVCVNNRLNLWLSWSDTQEPHRLASNVRQSVLDFKLKFLPGAFVGIGLPGSGGKGWQESLSQAQKALECCSTQHELTSYSDIALQDNLHLNSSVFNYYQSLAKQFLAEPKLVQTAKVWFEHGQHRKAAASKLQIHPNTLDNRLSRLEELLEGNLTQPYVVAKLYLVMTLIG